MQNELYCIVLDYSIDSIYSVVPLCIQVVQKRRGLSTADLFCVTLVKVRKFDSGIARRYTTPAMISLSECPLQVSKSTLEPVAHRSFILYINQI